ncbi:MAG TPA: tetratricopeptide repeat protein [Thermoanaerobaculia bacterium]|nr:tetratricopeptide repeat protein [Thermoanaerobaculia bacterium]
MCIVVVCAWSAIAQDADTLNRITTLETTLKSGSATHEEQLELARLYADVGRYHESRKLSQRMVDADANDADAVAIRDRSQQQLSLMAKQRVDDAEAAAKREGATDADRRELAAAYSAAGRYDDAEPLYAKLSTETPSPELDLEYGRMLSWMGAERAAVKRLERAYTASNSEAAAIALANAHAWDGHRDRGIVVLTEFTASHPDATEAQALLAEMKASPLLGIERLNEQIAADEFNLAPRVERARLYYESGQYNRALKDIEFIRKNGNGSELPDLSDIEEKSLARRKEEIAKLDERRRALYADGPMTSSSSGSSVRAQQMLDLAKGYTGLGAHEQAIDLYRDYLAAMPDDTTARLSYARVLSWDRRYRDSQKQYEIVLRETPDRPDIRLEYAQALEYNENYAPAMHQFTLLTDLSKSPRAYLYEDVPQRAHFHQGQIYRWYGWRDHAVESQNTALSLDSTYTDASRELERARLGRPATQLQARYTTETNSNDFTAHRGDLEGEHWLNQRLAVQGAVGRHNFEQGASSADANVVSGGALYRTTDQLAFRGRAGMTFWDEGLGTRPFFGVGATWLPNLQSRAAVDFNHYDLIYDVSNLASVVNDPISINDTRAHYDYDSGGFWSLLGDASYGFISDDNRRAAAHGLVAFKIFDKPWVAIKADGRYLQYDFRTNRYWSPDQYSSLAGVLQVGQNINDRVFWSAEIKAGKSWEDDRSSDLRAWGANVTVPVGDRFDVVGSYNYGRSGRFEGLVGDTEFTSYWQRTWYVGVRLKRLFTSDDRRARERYYFDNSVLGSDIVPPEVR